MNADNTLDDYDNEPIQSISDPIEPWNRFWFHFNDIFFLYVAKPAYTAWETVTPHQLRSGLKNFFSNLLFPVRFVNNILQFRFFEAGVEFGRFVINTTSSAGFADVAKGHKTIVPIDPTGEDFGQTLGRWGLGHAADECHSAGSGAQRVRCLSGLHRNPRQGGKRLRNRQAIAAQH